MTWRPIQKFKVFTMNEQPLARTLSNLVQERMKDFFLEINAVIRELSRLRDQFSIPHSYEHFTASHARFGYVYFMDGPLLSTLPR